MNRDVHDFIKKCKECQLARRAQYNNKAVGVFIAPPSNFNDRISIDHLGPFPVSRQGNLYSLTVQDQLTKYLTLILTVGVIGEEAAEKLVSKYRYVYGTPREIIMDNAKGLQSVIMKRILTLFKIKPIPISAGHPQSNGSLERAHSTIKER